MLIKFVLNAFPIYLMSVLKALKKAIVNLQSVLRSFLWNDNVSGRAGIPLLAWDKVCTLKNLGGSGIRDLGKQNLALGAKLVWKLYKEPSSKWALILFVKYLGNRPKEAIFIASSPTNGSIVWNFMTE